MRKILITGASGLIGKALSTHLIERGYTVHALVRSYPERPIAEVSYFIWDTENGTMDKEALSEVDTIIHLAGANIAALPWSNRVKKGIVTSRTKSITLLYNTIKKENIESVRHVISASATGYYNNRGNELMTETKPASLDFLGMACTAWENAVNKGKKLGLRTVTLRTGMVLDLYGGALPKLATSAHLGLSTALGSGKQWTPWIHLADAVGIYTYAIEHMDLSGPYNMVAPQSITNEQLVKAIARHLHKPYWLPNIPAFLIRGILGQMSELVLSSTKASAQKIIHTGYHFQYPTIDRALEQVYGQ
ncbi:TIGR01777 family oxidoreductase [Olivibacter sitiensis]|uniref:TIGR01777 family oxidoreductase n=1 Tax=Olivibacter sitiensis TaxID=376470 RepID=UPI00041F284E|nr:TIGR01777 family oxidoreductase [Olivibacter sitiensis]